jgi:hypothetical protein
LQKTAAALATAGPGSVVDLPDSDGTTTPRVPASSEKQFAFSLRTSLSDDDKRDALYSLLTTLGVIVDNGDSSFAEIMVRMRIKEEATDDLAAKVRATGPEATITDA